MYSTAAIPTAWILEYTVGQDKAAAGQLSRKWDCPSSSGTLGNYGVAFLGSEMY